MNQCEIYQDYIAGASLDSVQRFYWVITHEGDCFTKSYFNRPLGGKHSYVINEINSNLEVDISPIPVLKYFNVNFKGLYNGKIVLSVFNIMGQILNEKEFWKENIESNQTIDLGYQNSGIYYVRIVYNQTDQRIIKIIIVQ